MSKELKFRIWFKPTYEHKCEFMDRYGKKLPDLECRLYTQDVFFDDTWLDTDDYEDIIVEQYTGLKDKNGKEIYEGDIIQETIITDDTTDGTYRYEVYWDEDTLCWSIKGISDIDYHLRDDLWETNASREVIGNIHENPELLGDTNDTNMGDNEELIKLIEQEEKDGE